MKRRIANDMFRLPGVAVEVTGSDYRSLERALRTFNKKVTEDGRLKILKEREFYEKPSEVRRKRAAAAQKRWQRKLRESQPGFQR